MTLQEQVDQYCERNPEVLRVIIEAANRHQAEGDGDSCLLLAAMLVGCGNALKELVAASALLVQKDGLTLEDCLKKH